MFLNAGFHPFILSSSQLFPLLSSKLKDIEIAFRVVGNQELDVFEYSGYMETASEYADETALAKR